jgi:RNA polymerase sigma-70 factor (ECF subfamily)
MPTPPDRATPTVSRRQIAALSPGHVRRLAAPPRAARPLLDADDATLARALIAEDPEARAAVFGRYRPLVARMAARFFRSQADVDDVVQEVFVCLLSRVHTLSHPEALRNFILSITRFTITYQKKRFMRRRWEPLGEQHADFVSFRVAPEARQTLERVFLRVARAGTLGRMAFLLRFIVGLEILDVASVLGRSPATIKRHLSRTRRRVLAQVPPAERGAADHAFS